jgi:hypothetical protein
MSMARPWSDEGKREEARNLLTPGLQLSHRGLDILDLKKASVPANDQVPSPLSQ